MGEIWCATAFHFTACRSLILLAPIPSRVTPFLPFLRLVLLRASCQHCFYWRHPASHQCLILLRMLRFVLTKNEVIENKLSQDLALT